jgi:hypothetical protein
MKKYGLYLLACVATLLLLGGCVVTSDEIQADPGQEFSLSIGQSAVISGENLEIKFKEVVEDSRCATGATCIWEGRVSLVVEIKDNGSPYRMVLIQYGLNNQYVSETYNEYQLSFKVNPYPELGTEIASGDYRLLLTVSKD